MPNAVPPSGIFPLRAEAVQVKRPGNTAKGAALARCKNLFPSGFGSPRAKAPGFPPKSSAQSSFRLLPRTSPVRQVCICHANPTSFTEKMTLPPVGRR